jgi:hypothetical protein
MRNREHHPRTGIGLFFIILGLALLIATNDLLHLGSIGNYFTWQTAMVFIGVLLFANLNFTGGVLLISGGVWFYLQDQYIVIPSLIKTIYWPAVIMLLGLSFIISSLVRRKKNIN